MRMRDNGAACWAADGRRLTGSAAWRRLKRMEQSAFRLSQGSEEATATRSEIYTEPITLRN
jgi:hypothetical protein